MRAQFGHKNYWRCRLICNRLQHFMVYFIHMGWSQDNSTQMPEIVKRWIFLPVATHSGNGLEAPRSQLVRSSEAAIHSPVEQIDLVRV